MKKLLLRASVFMVVALLTNQLIQFFALSSINVFEVQGKFTPGTKIFLNSSNGIYPVNNETRAGVNVSHSDSKQTLFIQLQDRLIDQFRLDILHNKTEFELDSIQFHSHFSISGYKWNQMQIQTDMKREDSANLNRTSFHLQIPVDVDNYFIYWIVPILLGLMAVLFVINFDFRSFPLLLDLQTNQQHRSTSNLLALDGFRGIAALVVLMHHATMTFKGWGQMGVWMFFVLSGFLLTKPFVIDPIKSIKIPVLTIYLTRRFKRIVPMYFFMVTIVFLFQGHYDVSIRHYLFIQGDLHYWTVLQEMYFYLLLPLITGMGYLLFRGKPLLTILMLIILGVAWNKFGTTEVLSIYSLNQLQRWFIEVFLIGMVGAYWYHGIYVNNENLQTFIKKYQWIFSLIGIVGLLVLMDISIRGGNFFEYHLSAEKSPILYATICIALLLLAVIGSEKCWYKKILSNPFLRCIGIIGYSFYLIHPYAIFITRNAIEHYFLAPYTNVSDIWLLGSSFLLTFIFSAFTYSYIERPFLMKATSKD